MSAGEQHVTDRLSDDLRAVINSYIARGEKVSMLTVSAAIAMLLVATARHLSGGDLHGAATLIDIHVIPGLRNVVMGLRAGKLDGSMPPTTRH